MQKLRVERRVQRENTQETTTEPRPKLTTAAAAISATQFLRRGADAAVTGRSGACSFMLNVW